MDWMDWTVLFNYQLVPGNNFYSKSYFFAKAFHHDFLHIKIFWKIACVFCQWNILFYRYRPIIPSDFTILTKQSPRPRNSRSFFFPTSAASRVRAKSNGYTKHKLVAPAAPPLAKFPEKDAIFISKIQLNILVYQQRIAKTASFCRRHPRTSAYMCLWMQNSTLASGNIGERSRNYHAKATRNLCKEMLIISKRIGFNFSDQPVWNTNLKSN